MSKFTSIAIWSSVLFSLPLLAGAYGQTVVTSVSAGVADGIYQSGQTISVVVHFSAPVTVTPYVWGGSNQAWPVLRLSLDAGTTTATYVSGSGTTDLVFNYVIGATDATAHLGYASTTSLLYNSVDPSQVTVRDGAGDPVNLILPVPGQTSSLAANSYIIIGLTGAGPVLTVSSPKPDGTYKAGEIIPIKVFFNQAVTVTPYLWRSYDPSRLPRWSVTQSDYPALALSFDGGLTRYVAYSSGSGTNALTFNYTVAVADRTSRLAYSSTDALSFRRDYLNLNDPATGVFTTESAVGSVKNAGGDELALTLPTAGGDGSLDKNKNIKISNAFPTVTLLGNASVNVARGATYTENGAIASDSLDGNLTGAIVMTGGPVNVNRVGVFNLVYTVTNTAGASASVNRTVYIRNNIDGVPTSDTTATGATITIAGGDSYLYQIDNEATSTEQFVASGTPITLTGLSLGAHTLSLWGRSNGDAWPATPSTYSWNVVDATGSTPPVGVSGGGGGGGISVVPADVNWLNNNNMTTAVASTTGPGQVLGLKVYSFTKTLRVGKTGEDVKLLQFLLIKKNAGKEAAALAEVGITGYFGNLTKNALKEYQKAFKLQYPNGIFNKPAREHFEKLSKSVNVSLSKLPA